MIERLGFSGGLATTAMGILPHEDVGEALALALTMDIPFWPQLPKLSFFEDMYIQAMDRFPGARIDDAQRRIYVDTDGFMAGIGEYLEREGDPEYFRLSEQFSQVYRRFLDEDLSEFRAVRGQIISPVSLTLKITDENGRPIVYNDEIRSFAFSFIRNKLNVQREELRERNEMAFVWIDDPGLEFIFNAMCGYDHIKAKEELATFFDGVEGPRGLHLCGRPDWDFLLSLNIDILSFNAYAFGDTFVTYDRVKPFIEAGNIISWGIVPSLYEEFFHEDLGSLERRLLGMWNVLEAKGIDRAAIIRQSILAPATCNLMNPDKAETVEHAFGLLNELSLHMKERYR